MMPCEPADPEQQSSNGGAPHAALLEGIPQPEHAGKAEQQGRHVRPRRDGVLEEHRVQGQKDRRRERGCRAHMTRQPATEYQERQGSTGDGEQERRDEYLVAQEQTQDERVDRWVEAVLQSPGVGQAQVLAKVEEPPEIIEDGVEAEPLACPYAAGGVEAAKKDCWNRRGGGYAFRLVETRRLLA